MSEVPPSRVYGESQDNRPAEVIDSSAGIFAASVGAIAAMASFEEALLAPKPGLVDPDGSGSHTDMNWTTFVRGASALAPHWRDQALMGAMGARHGHYKPSDGLAERLRAKGTEMERVMFGATGGVNTHKGLIFVLSLLLAGWGIAYARRETSVAAALDMSSEIISPCLLAELEGIKSRAAAGGALTHGERIFARYGLGGIRSEVTRGFPSLRRGLAALEDALSGGAAIRDAALYALLVLMMECEDTNVIHRAGVDFWRGEYKENISATLRKFNPLKPSYYEPMLDLDRFLMRHGASPGGAADLLACTLFIYRSKISGNSFENY